MFYPGFTPPPLLAPVALGPLLEQLSGPILVSVVSWFGIIVASVVAISLLLLAVGFLGLRLLRRIRKKQDGRRTLGGQSERSADTIHRVLSRTVPKLWTHQFVDGLRAPLDGLRFMNAHPWRDGWRFAVFPAVFSLLATAVAVAGLAAVLIGTAGPVHDWFEPTWLSRAMEVGAFLLIVLGAGGLAFGFWLLMQTLFCSFYFSKLTLQVERLIGVDESELQEASLRAQTKDDVKSIAHLLSIQLGLLVTNIIPGLGAVVSASGGFYFSALFAGAEFQDYPLIARGLRLPQRREFTKRHRFHTLGLGAATMGQLLIPGIGAMLLSCSVAGAVLQFHRLTTANSDDAAV